ncbi:MAG TPA: EcsC family protein [Myxococcales bacterium]|nr:EcsC family protein [Myxococcales bacterium]
MAEPKNPGRAGGGHPEAGALPEEARRALQDARARLERTTLADRLLDGLGRPLERGLARLPDRAKRLVEAGTYKSLETALRLALGTLPEPAASDSRDGLHQAAVALTGASGFFGLAALPFELPITTGLMLRSIADIARSYGEDLRDPGARLACLEVFALRGGGGQDAPVGYFGVRTVLSRTLREAALYLASGGAAEAEAPILVKLIAQIAERFGLSVSERAAATAVPIVGAVGGAAVNFVFLRHFQELAHGHFTVRRLERAYGEAAVKAAYES